MEDDDWQEMPVVRDRLAATSSASSSSSSDDADDVYGRSAERKGAKASSTRKGRRQQFSVAQEYRRGTMPPSFSSASINSSPTSPYKSARRGVLGLQGGASNATGRHLDIQDARGYDWRAKPKALDDAGGMGPACDSGSKRKGKQRSKAKNRGDASSSSSSSSSDEEEGEGNESGARGYTQLRIDDDPEQENLNAATDYLFTGAAGGGSGDMDNSGATPQSQLHTTKNILSEGQKIAYVGLVSLSARALVRQLERVPGKEVKAAVASADEWRLRVMARLFQHMDIETGEQAMIESLAEHGVLSKDLAPSLVTTQTVENPDFDPEAALEREEEEEREREESAERMRIEEEERALSQDVEQKGAEEAERLERERRDSETQPDEGEQGGVELRPSQDNASTGSPRRPLSMDSVAGDLGALDDEGAEEIQTDASIDEKKASHERLATSVAHKGPPSDTDTAANESLPGKKSQVDDEADGDISQALGATNSKEAATKEDDEAMMQGAEAPQAPILDPNTASQIQPNDTNTTPMGLTNQPQSINTLPSALEGVTTELSSADMTITLDLRWTVLCDLFLVLTADSVYDARSRVLLETVADELGLTWMDVTKFEKRVTDALEIEEGVSGSLKGKKALRKRAEMVRRRRLVMMGLATVGGGLVIGLSAGVMAPLIGVGLGAALGSVGIGGTSTFLTGAGGIALVTSTGAFGGAALGGVSMNRRTRTVSTFEFKPIHNNKRVNCIITIPGFMSGPQDDPRLPFSVIDSIMGDIMSLLWEPDMMQEMGNAIYLLWNETIVQGVQQVLAATIASGLVGALAFPLWLTKLGYFIDNPWSNALDRAHSCGLILADVLAKRKVGVRPITLVGFSLGARVIFYALVELARTKKFGIVQNVYLMGAPVTANDKTWKEARSIVAGRFVNAFSRSDWILGWLFRATTGGIGSIAGLRPVERVPEVENVDVTRTVPGHLQYRAFMPLVLDQLGFKTTADYFDEPEDLEAIPEREVLYDESDRQLKTVKTSSGGFGKIFRRNNKAPTIASNGGSTPSTVDETSRRGSAVDDDDDLPPREDSAHSAHVATNAGQGGVAEKTLPATALESPVPSTSALSPDDEMAQILAELRESGIEVRELESSLPPLVASSQARRLSQAQSSTSPANDAAQIATIEPRPGTPVARASESGPAAVDETPRQQPLRDASGRDYFGDQSARSYGTSFHDLPPTAPAISESADVSLSFGDSYEGEEHEDADEEKVGQAASQSNSNSDASWHPHGDLKSSSNSSSRNSSIASCGNDYSAAQKQYGLSSDAARELAMQFESSGMSAGGALAAARLAQNFDTLERGGADGGGTGKGLQPPPNLASSTGRSARGSGDAWSSGATADPWASMAADAREDLTPLAPTYRKASTAGSSNGSSVHGSSHDSQTSRAGGEGSALPPSTHAWDNDNPWG